MHIAFLTPEYPHELSWASGGLGTSIKNLVEGLVQEGIKVSIVLYGQEKKIEFSEKNIDFYFLKKQNYSFGGWYKHRKWLQNFLNTLIDEKQVDLVEAPDWTGITAFMRLKAPLIIRLHGSDAYFCALEGRKQKFKNRFFERYALKNASAWVAPTEFALKTTESVFDLKKNRSKVIHYGLDLEKFENPNPDQYQNGLILYLGTIIRKKGVFELPAILQEVQKINPKCKLVIIGADSNDIKTKSSSTWELLEKEFESKALSNVQYLGKMQYNQVQKFICEAHICVFPSYAETLGMVTIESMAMNKAVVNTNIGWANELITNGESGFLVFPADHRLYAERIVQLMDDPSLVARLGGMARKQVLENFSKELIVQKNIDFFTNIISKSGNFYDSPGP